MKKYHHSPTLGVRSGSRRWTPYAEDKNFQDPPARALDIYNSHPILAENIDIYLAEKAAGEGAPFADFARWSKHSRSNGGRRRAGYSARYEASPNANMELIGFPVTALAIAMSVAQFVKMLVGRPMQLAMVKGLKRYL